MWSQKIILNIARAKRGIVILSDSYCDYNNFNASNSANHTRVEHLKKSHTHKYGLRCALSNANWLKYQLLVQFFTKCIIVSNMVPIQIEYLTK